MREVRESQQATQDLDALEQAGRSSLLDKIDKALDWIEDGDARARRIRFKESPLDPGGVWIIQLHDHDEDWLLASSDTPSLGDDVTVVHTIRRALAPRGQ